MCIRDRADAKQISNPFGVFCIIFVAFYSFDPFRIGDDHADSLFLQDVKDRNPVLSGGFHADIQTVVLAKPIGKAIQIGVESGEPFLLVARL